MIIKAFWLFQGPFFIFHSAGFIKLSLLYRKFCVKQGAPIFDTYEKFNFPIREVGADAGYDYIEVHKGMMDLGIKTFIPIIDGDKLSRSDVFPPSMFRYDSNEVTPQQAARYLSLEPA